MYHKISVPVYADDDYVYFNHKSFYFIFTWGNGKCDKRLWLEERGHYIQANYVYHSDFENFFELFNDAEKQHVTTNGWV